MHGFFFQFSKTLFTQFIIGALPFLSTVSEICHVSLHVLIFSPLAMGPILYFPCISYQFVWLLDFFVCSFEQCQTLFYFIQVSYDQLNTFQLIKIICVCGHVYACTCVHSHAKTTVRSQFSSSTMSSRAQTQAIMFSWLALCLAELSCQFNPFEV